MVVGRRAIDDLFVKKYEILVGFSRIRFCD